MIVIGSGKSTTTHEQAVLREDPNSTHFFSDNSDGTISTPLYQAFDFYESSGRFVVSYPTTAVDDLYVGNVLYRTNNGTSGTQLYKFEITQAPIGNDLQTKSNMTTYYVKTTTVYDGTELTDVIYNDKALTKIIVNNKTVFEKDPVVYTAVDANGVHEGTMYYNGTPVEYHIGLPDVTLYKYVMMDVAPETQEDYYTYDVDIDSYKYYYDTSTNTYVSITSDNIATLIADGIIIVGQTKPYLRLITQSLEEAQGQTYFNDQAKNGSGVMYSYIGDVVIDKLTLNGLPITKILTNAFDDVEQYPTNLKILRNFDLWEPYCLYAKDSIYINSAEILGPGASALIYGGLSNCAVTIGKDVTKMYYFMGGTVSCSLYFEEGSKMTELGFDHGSSSDNVFMSVTFLNEVVLPSSITYIHGFSNSCKFGQGLVIPRSVTGIDAYAFDSISSGSVLKFLHSSTDTITLSATMFGSPKSATTITIYTDNQTVRNFDYSAKNITPTFYHLDGTAW